MSFFNAVEKLPDDAILSLNVLYKEDPRLGKVNLGVGAYQDDNGNSAVLETVRLAEAQLLAAHLDKNYLPIGGDAGFCAAALVALVPAGELSKEPLHWHAIQSVGATGALRIGAEFLLNTGYQRIWISDPSWLNHHLIFQQAGLEVGSYPYYDAVHGGLNFNALWEALERLPEGDVVLLQVSCHNPTGVDLEEEHWIKLVQLFKERRLIPFFDCAYQGFGLGFEEDSAPIRHFWRSGIEMLLAYSFSKNMGLYGERVGVFALATHAADQIPAIASQIKRTIRSNYSMPPLQGMRIAKQIMSDSILYTSWQRELAAMRKRVISVRNDFIDRLSSQLPAFDFSSLRKQKGFFSFLGLSPLHVQRLYENNAIFIPLDGRINVAGLNAQNLDYVIDSLAKVLTS